MSFAPADYAFLLGMYLGDGNISRVGRTYSLRITLDARYPRIIDETAAVLRRCLHRNRVNCVTKDAGSAVVVVAHSVHLPCLFPQHGPGKKHERDVSLESWQQDLVDRAPWAVLRGLLWSDGCSFVNRTGRYEYLSWHFSNRSPHIRALFARTCDAVGIAHREYADHFRINRRACSELLCAHVGVKA
jgi:hypothetical protein